MTGSEQNQRAFLYYADQLLGTVESCPASGELLLSYSRQWRTHGFELSPLLPLLSSKGPQLATNFFRQLLPNQGNDKHLLKLLRLTTNALMPQLLALNDDLLGAIRFSPNQTTIKAPLALREISSVGLVQRIAQRNHISIDIWDNVYRAGLPGEHKKLLVIETPDRKLHFSSNSLHSTHFLSFNHQESPHSTLNRYVCSMIARDSALHTADMRLIRYGRHLCLLNRRVDRRLSADRQRVLRRHMILAGQAIAVKTGNLGDSSVITELFRLTAACALPVAQKITLIDWLIMSLLMHDYNNDTHQIAFHGHNGKLMVAPFFGFENHQIEISPSKGWQLKWGRSGLVNDYSNQLLDELAACIGIDKKWLYRRVVQRIGNIQTLAKPRAVIAKIQSSLALLPDEVDFITRLCTILNDNAQRMSELVNP